MGSLFVTSYSLALGDPVPHRIDAALVGDPTGQASTVQALERVADGSLAFHRYPSVPAAVHAIDEQDPEGLRFTGYLQLPLSSSRWEAVGSCAGRITRSGIVSFSASTLLVVSTSCLRPPCREPGPPRSSSAP
jgi:hypothetical protein